MRNRKKSIFQRHPVITLIFINILLLLVFDISIANVYKYIYGYSFHDRSRIKAEEINRLYRVRSDNYDHDLVKNISIDNAMAGGIIYKVRTDSLGFINDSVKEVPLESDRYRVLFIGDSFTEGWGFEYESTFVGIVSKELSKSNIEVLNAAVISYSPIIYWRKIKYLIEEVGLKFNEVVVCLDISDVQDEALSYELNSSGNVATKPNMDNDQKFSEMTKAFFRNNSIYLFIIFKAAKQLISPPFNYQINSKTSLWTIDETLFKEYGKSGLDKMELYMDKLYDLLDEHNIKLTVAVYPWPDQIYHKDLDSAQVAFWEKWTTSKGVPFINYFPYFINNENSGIEILEQYFIPTDVHWNKKGHK